MRSSAVKKQGVDMRRVSSLALVETHRDARLRRLEIARACEEAANLPGNDNAPDFEEFLSQYGPANASDFA